MKQPTNHDDAGRADRPATDARTDPSRTRVSLRYAFNPEFDQLASTDPDELIVFDVDRTGPGDRWITAKRGSYLPLDEAR